MPSTLPHQALASATVLLLIASAAAAAPTDPSNPAKLVALGDQFQINSYTTGNQFRPVATMDAEGNFVVLWESGGSGGSDTSSLSLQAQRFASDGAPLANQFQVNSYTTYAQWLCAVAGRAAGDFVVLWYGDGSGGTDTAYGSIHGQRVGSGGNLLGGEFQVNSYTTGEQSLPDVAMDAGGDFVAVWQSDPSLGMDPSGSNIWGQRYASDGNPLGGEFQVNSYTTSFQGSPAVAADADGDFVVVWEGYGSVGTDDSEESIQGQRYSSDGTPLGHQFQVNSYTTLDQWWAAVGMESDGAFVVAWASRRSTGTDSSGYSVPAQRFASDGARLGSQFQVNSYTTHHQWYPSIAIDEEGDFVVVWESRRLGIPGERNSVRGQFFTSSGIPAGAELLISSYTSGDPEFPTVAMAPNGDFVVVWDSYGSEGTDSDGWSIQGRRFAGPEIFADGFESGDASAWSSVFPSSPTPPAAAPLPFTQPL